MPALDGGGVEQGTLEIGEALVAAGHRSVVISGGGSLVARLEQQGSEHHRLPIGAKSPLVLAHVPRLRRLLRRISPDVVHVRSRLPAWITRWALRGLTPRPPLVTTLHGLNSVSRYSRIMTTGDVVIAVSETCRDYWLRHYPDLAPERVRVIHRGIDPARYSHGYQPAPEWVRTFRRRFEIPEHARLVTLPGRIVGGKGHRHLARALAALDQDVYGLVVGGGRPRARRRLERLAADLGVADRLVFTGHRSDVRDILAISDVVVAPSIHPESFGRTVLEALALGRPVVGFGHGGVGEILGRLYPDGQVPAGDGAAFVERLRRFLNEGYPTVPSDQPWLKSRMQRETLALYEELAHVAQDTQH